MVSLIGPSDVADVASSFAMCIGLGFGLGFGVYASWWLVGQFRRWAEDWR